MGIALSVGNALGGLSAGIQSTDRAHAVATLVAMEFDRLEQAAPISIDAFWTASHTGPLEPRVFENVLAINSRLIHQGAAASESRGLASVPHETLVAWADEVRSATAAIGAEGRAAREALGRNVLLGAGLAVAAVAVGAYLVHVERS